MNFIYKNNKSVKEDTYLKANLPSELFNINNKVFVNKLSTLILLLSISYLLIFKDNYFLKFTGIFVTANLYAHALELQHQCLHNTALTNRKLNYLIGFILGIPMFVSYTNYQMQHMHHHRFVGTASDKEFLIGVICASPIWFFSLTKLIGSIRNSLPTYFFKIINIFSGILFIFFASKFSYLLWENFL